MTDIQQDAENGGQHSQISAIRANDRQQCTHVESLEAGGTVAA